VLPGVKGAAVPLPVPPSVAPAAVNPRGRLLFIDDERDTCEVVEEALASIHTVVATTDARQALQLLAAGQHFDVILCDIRMPEMTGVDFLSRLEIDNPAQASRVVLMSGGYVCRPEDPPIVRSRKLLEKPFTIDQVSSLMREAMQREPLAAG
jgi:CheY-like chemotaxis protein